MLEDYIFDDHLRYQGHKLIYTFPEPTEEPIVIGGILGAAILCVRLINTDEQQSREIVLDEKLHYAPFFIRYEQEVIGDDWGHIAAELEQLAPAIVPKKRDVRQELELDNILPVPPERNYVKVREYIIERCKYDKNFEKFYKSHKMTQFCDQLSLLFDWYVDPNALGKRMKSKPKK